MNSTVISVNGLGKKYKLGTTLSHDTLRDQLAHSIRSLWRTTHQGPRTKDPGEKRNNEIWAIKDISFKVNQGEAVGIIGRNGAGKSTLLKVIGQITEPTTGEVRIRGRVASLLEVGTGFHGELTGRENIYLNGAILGMKKKEIHNKFDAIVNFAELEKFIDTPVKRYSSGMYVRLAFAVAAHLEPEILVIDEVLAVGDGRFQKKCLGKMDETAQEGRTVLFVSHNMAAITRLCHRAILLHQGRIQEDGPSNNVVGTYLRDGAQTTAVREWHDLSRAPGNEWVRLWAMRVRSEDGRIAETHDIRHRVKVEIEYQVLTGGQKLAPKYHLVNNEGIIVFVSQDTDLNWRHKPRDPGRYISVLNIPGNFLSEGSFSVSGAVVSFNPNIVHFFEHEVVTFQVVDRLDGDSARGDYTGDMPGIVRPLLTWNTHVFPT